MKLIRKVSKLGCLSFGGRLVPQPHCSVFAWAVQSTQEAYWSPLDEGSIVGPFQVLLGKAKSHLHATAPCFSCPACGSGGSCPDHVLFDQAPSCRAGRVPSVKTCPIELAFALNRRRERVFCPNPSPFSNCCISSLNGGRERVLVLFLHLFLSWCLSSFFLFAECVRASRQFLSERG